MTRILTAPMAEALIAGRPRGLFLEMDHPDGVGRFCTGISSRPWNGHTWTATGTLGKISPIKRSSEIAIQDIVFSLSGVSTDVINRLSADVRNRIAYAWLACFSADDDSVIPDPYRLVNAQLDFQTFEADGEGTARVDVIAHSGFYTLDRSVDEAWTPENQKLTYPTDTGFDMIPGLQHQDLQWTPS